MTLPAQLGPVEQHEMLSQLTMIALGAAPDGWLRIFAEYRAVGDHVESGAGIKWPDGSTTRLDPPEEFWDLYWRLRVRMAHEGTGAWVSSLLRIQQPGTYDVKFNREVEPKWVEPPSAAEFVNELRRFPRTADNIPDWFNAKLDD